MRESLNLAKVIPTGDDSRDPRDPKDKSPNESVPRTSRRGFASMSKDKQREIARKGGRAAHLKGTAHEFSSDEARAAGKKGGESVSRDRSHMAQIGREGGQARSARLQKRAPLNGTGNGTTTGSGSGASVPQETTSVPTPPKLGDGGDRGERGGGEGA